MIKWRGVFALSRERVVECVSISLLLRGRVFGNYRSERRRNPFTVVDRGRSRRRTKQLEMTISGFKERTRKEVEHERIKRKKGELDMTVIRISTKVCQAPGRSSEWDAGPGFKCVQPSPLAKLVNLKKCIGVFFFYVVIVKSESNGRASVVDQAQGNEISPIVSHAGHNQARLRCKNN